MEYPIRKERKPSTTNPKVKEVPCPWMKSLWASAGRRNKMIGEVTLAIVEKIGLKRISGVIHPYPTQAEAIKRVADLYNRTRLTTGAKRWFERWMAWRR